MKYQRNPQTNLQIRIIKKKSLRGRKDFQCRYVYQYQKLLPVRLQGLDADRMYRVKEINLMPGSNSSFQGNNQLYSGEYLMNVGLEVFTTQQLNSRIVEITAE